jgi:hypothetical protein
MHDIEEELSSATAIVASERHYAGRERNPRADLAHVLLRRSVVLVRYFFLRLRNILVRSDT